jgi:AcrR family transcriptional regulator
VKRRYELKRRAERQAETQRRIVEAAVELHGTIGPARTTISAIAERAGVQRHTFYRHFPDERALGLACSGHYMQLVPPPDPERWRAVGDPEQRLRRALTELYAYFERAEPMLANIIRDAEVDPLTREIMELRRGPGIRRMRAVLGAGVRGRRRLALIDLALDFHTWRRLVRESGLSPEQAVETIVRALRCQ